MNKSISKSAKSTVKASVNHRINAVNSGDLRNKKTNSGNRCNNKSITETSDHDLSHRKSIHVRNTVNSNHNVSYQQQ